MSDLDAIQNVLARAARRRRLQRAWNGSWQGLFAGALVWLAVFGVYKLAPIPESILIGACGVALLCVVAGFLHGWFKESNMQQAARCVDDRQRLQERLSTALELARAGGNETWRALIVADAARFAAKIDPRKIFPFQLPRVTRWALLVLALGASLGFVPELRSKEFVEKKQDAAVIKDVAKRIVEVTHRSLEQRPPMLEATHKAIEATEELGMRLDKNPLTRNDALKDLANVADKLKAQLKDLGQKNPAFKALAKEAREASSGRSSLSPAEQKQMDALQKSAEKSGETSAALDKLANDLQKMQKAMAGLPKDNSPGANAARQKMADQMADLAKKAAALGQPMPNLDEAIAALKAGKTDDFQKDVDAATTDLEKMKDLAKSMEQAQEQSEKQGRDLPEQLKFGQADAAKQTLQKMAEQLKSGSLSPEQLKKMLDEVSRGVDPAAPFGKAADFLKEATQQMKSGDKMASAESLKKAAGELEKASAEMADAKDLQASLDAVNKAEMALATHRAWGECPECGDCSGRCLSAGRCLGLGKGGKSRGGVGTWTDDDSQLYPEFSKTWDNTGSSRSDMDARGLTDRGDPQLADNLAATRVHGQIAPGSPMPSITLKGVSIKGQSSVNEQEAVTTAQSDAQSALNHDQVPRAYQGAVKDYFDDLKK